MCCARPRPTEGRKNRREREGGRWRERARRKRRSKAFAFTTHKSVVSPPTSRLYSVKFTAFPRKSSFSLVLCLFSRPSNRRRRRNVGLCAPGRGDFVNVKLPVYARQRRVFYFYLFVTRDTKMRTCASIKFFEIFTWSRNTVNMVHTMRALDNNISLQLQVIAYNRQKLYEQKRGVIVSSRSLPQEEIPIE